MDTYIKVYSNNKSDRENEIDSIISAGYSIIKETNHNVKRVYGKDNFLLIYIKKGNLFLFNNNTYKKLSEGSLVIFAPEQLQRYYFDHQPENENYWIHFCGLKDILKELNLFTQDILIQNIGIVDKIISLWKDIITEIQLSTYASKVMSNSMFIQLLTHISRAIYKIENPKNTSIFKQLAPAITSMYNDYNENYSNLYYAKLCNLSESSFYHLFAKTFHSTPNKYLNDIRLRAAENLLFETDYSLEKISSLTGYNTPQYFSKIFKEKHKISPLKYRNIHT